MFVGQKIAMEKGLLLTLLVMTGVGKKEIVLVKILMVILNPIDCVCLPV